MNSLVKLFKALTVITISVLFGCEEVLEVPDISNQVVEVIAPKDSAIVTLTNVNFAWHETADTESYKIQVVRPSFEQAAEILLDSTIVLDSTFLGTKATKNLASGNYEWRVKAVNSGYETVYTANKFIVQISENQGE
ncbi:hypothetical protein [Cytophaga sp. FL35]|uniref:hypothetical protein n=1 Tax=Cytophaga sp. FL35 TaxID=1904456 RepID=UPI001653E80A|nr:hypothetical protein [Cytophaga sp. FL35]MBC6999639.1 hypothetical protein [Cytophaga sp. FL35]